MRRRRRRRGRLLLVGVVAVGGLRAPLELLLDHLLLDEAAERLGSRANM